MKRILYPILLATLLISCDSNSQLGIWLDHEAVFEVQKIFDTERFPNIVTATDGSIVATWGSSKVVSRRSDDAGQSWSDIVVIADPGFQGGGTTVDDNTGKIFAFVEEGHPVSPLHIYRSEDMGKTWSELEYKLVPDENGNLPSMHMNEHGITLHHQSHRGRLIRPARYYGKKNDRTQWPNHYTTAIYSDDRGLTWHTSDPFPEHGTGEAALAELADGTIYYNSRVHWEKRPRNTRRRSAFSITMPTSPP